MNDFILRIGIYTRPEIRVRFHGPYRCQGQLLEGAQCLKSAALYEPAADDAYFELEQVTIGVNFHWQRNENQCFKGALELVAAPEGGWIAVNRVPLEVYLTSVISSEMSAESDMELLKAHAVISRSWAIRAMAHPNHEGYDVCADDHCQRYEGLRRMNERAVEAVWATSGQVLMFGDEVCDCRYHKCCGGRTEVWRTCWEDRDVEYIQSVPCDFCQSPSPKILQLVLNDYDQETRDFHDWQVRYKDAELDAIIAEKSGIDFGHITALEPLHRGASGRIDSLKIVGTKHTETIGKELKIRLWLSKTCLYSSWFEVHHADGLWTLTGHGWGHGAGLCQIGAAVMASEGQSYDQILSYYYRNAKLRSEGVKE